MKKKSVLIVILIFAAFIPVVCAPPEFHSVSGTAYESDCSTKYSGVDMTILDEDSDDRQHLNALSDPPFLAGTYSTQVYGNDGDTTYVWAYNDSHYGEQVIILAGDHSDVDVCVNMTRPAEPKVTIVRPEKDVNVSEGDFIVNVTIENIGYTLGTNCAAYISFNSSDIDFDNDTAQHNLTNIAVGSTIQTYWNLTTKTQGHYKVTVNATCDNSTNLENYTERKQDFVIVSDTQAPNITLVSPANDSVWDTNNLVIFTYSVNDNSKIANCSLFIDGTLNSTNSSITRDENQSFEVTMPNGNYTWKVRCTDNSSNINTGDSKTFSLGVNYIFYFYVNSVDLDDLDGLANGIDLESNNKSSVNCSGKAAFSEGWNNISSVSAVIFDGNNSFSSDSDGYTKHYTNSSCHTYNISSTELNFECLFDVYFHANPGPWKCNATATLNNGSDAYNTTSETINELLAIDIEESEVDFGTLQVGSDTGDKDYNITIKNLGNIAFNLTLYAYGQNVSDNLSMLCETNNITVESIKYSGDTGQDYSSKTSCLKDGNSFSLNLNKQTSDTSTEPTNKTMYWGMGIPSDTAVTGQCSGYVNIQANRP